MGVFRSRLVARGVLSSSEAEAAEAAADAAVDGELGQWVGAQPAAVGEAGQKPGGGADAGAAGAARSDAPGAEVGTQKAEGDGDTAATEQATWRGGRDIGP